MQVKCRFVMSALILAGSAAAGCGDDQSNPIEPGDSGTQHDSGPDSSTDATGPEITLNGAEEIVIDCGQSYVEPGASALDGTDGNVTVTSSGADQISTTAPGQFVITYTAQDAAGNVSEEQRTVYVCGPGCGEAGKAPINLSNWSVIQYEQDSQPDANWLLAGDGLSVEQKANADASILLSDFEVSDMAIEGGWSMSTSADDDFVGFVFGYQDRGHFYLFDWKRGTQSVTSGTAEMGMSLKIVNLGAFADGGADSDAGSDAGSDAEALLIQLRTADLWPTAGSPNVQVIRQNGVPLHNDIPWEFNTNYSFFLEFHPGSFRITVREVEARDAGSDAGGTELVSWSVQDSTYQNGRFGFYNYSQGPVTYTSFTRRDTPGACSTVERDQ